MVRGPLTVNYGSRSRPPPLSLLFPVLPHTGRSPRKESFAVAAKLACAARQVLERRALARR